MTELDLPSRVGSGQDRGRARRSLPKTVAYLKAELGAVQMEFLNKVAQNSRPNGFALFFGKSEESGSRAIVGLPRLVADWDRAEKCHEYLDKYSYDLEEYRLSGYKTMVAQDWDVGFVYYQNCTGFNRSEADHMWRLAIGGSSSSIDQIIGTSM
ncbi:hypothetical protein OSTOST_02447 [Ostertagia ostertagi]